MHLQKSLLLFLFFGCQLLYGQSAKEDSLLQVLARVKSAAHKVDVLLELADQNFRDLHTTYLDYSMQAKLLSDSIGYQKGLARALRYVANVKNHGGSPREGLELAKKSLAINEKLQDFTELYYAHLTLCTSNTRLGNYFKVIEHGKAAKEIAGNKLPHLDGLDVRTHLGTAYKQIGDYAKAMELFMWCLDYCEKEPSCSLVGPLYKIGRMHWHLGNLDKALSFFEQGLKVSLAESDLYGQGNGFLGLGEVYLRKGDLVKAENHLLTALGKFEEIKTVTNQATVYFNLGTVAARNEHYEHAAANFDRAIAFYEMEDNPRRMSETLGNIGDMYFQQGLFEKSLQQYLTAAGLAGQIQFKDQLARMNKKLAKAYRTMGDSDRAYLYFQQYSMLKDTLFEEGKLRYINEMEAKYELSKKQSQIEVQTVQLNRQRVINWGIGLLAVLLSALAFLLWRNVRQRKRTNAQLRRLDRAKSRFFSNISHELRTPLTLMLAPLEESIELSKSKAQKEHLNTARANGKKLLTFINEILDLSKLESGKMQLKETPVELEKLLRRILFSYQSLANLRRFNLSFSYHLPYDLAVKFDIEKFEKILNNLLSNAFKYSNEEGVITLRANATPRLPKGGESTLRSTEAGGGSPFRELEGRGRQWLQIEVEDQGKGIPADELSKIFDRFYQVEGEDEPLQGGTGIGLAYAKELANLFGGDLNVKSELGKGTTFILTIPMKKAKVENVVSKVHSEPPGPGYSGERHPAEGPRKEKYVPISFNGQKPRILIVEDNPEMSKFLFQLLEPYYRCSAAPDGKKALDLMGKESFDLITSDVMMPNMDGFAFLKKVREHANLSQVPFVLLTARSLGEDKLKGLHLGVDDYITKPFRKRELLARFDNLLKNKAQRDEWLRENAGGGIAETTGETLSAEKTMLQKAETLVFENLSDSTFKVEDLAREMAYGHRQMARIIRKQTGMSPIGFIREIRLQKANQLLREKQYLTISEVSYAVGFENASYFAKKFAGRYGKLPSEV